MAAPAVTRALAAGGAGTAAATTTAAAAATAAAATVVTAEATVLAPVTRPGRGAAGDRADRP